MKTFKNYFNNNLAALVTVYGIIPNTYRINKQ